MEKYYTPTIDEFHVGFEFEEFGRNIAFLEMKDKHWYENVFTKHSSAAYIQDHIADFRVKYLDREDIESLQFNPIHIGFKSAIFQYREHNISLHWWPKENRLLIQSNKITLFNGTIRNKLELKKLMSQIGIKQLSLPLQ